jgi:hypothetical protein
MRAIWSLWSKPLRARRRPGWLSPKHHLLAWVLSVELGRRHYPDCALMTDDAGAAMLVDGLGLRFRTVSLALNALDDHDPDWWAIGKLYAYAAQHEPFVHIDNDVFLWDRLPMALEHADVFGQHPETTPYGRSFYRPESIEFDIRRHGGWMPLEFERYMPIGGDLIAENCGIFGGCRTDFIRHYARQAIRFVEHPANQAAWAGRPRRDQDFVTFEQLMVSACVAYHQQRPESPYADVRLSHLFESYGEALEQAAGRGYTHLVAESKRDAELGALLERAVEGHFPAEYRRVLEYLEREEGAGMAGVAAAAADRRTDAAPPREALAP